MSKKQIETMSIFECLEAFGVDRSSQALLRCIIERQIRDNEKSLKLWRKDRQPHRFLKEATSQLKSINSILMGDKA
tara:strand:- start:555 stop:782 length:228 start_codon:yes stop_codon:yes gene_type:complete